MKPWLNDGDIVLYHGDALDVLRTLPDGSVHMCATSPPFYGLRDYGTGSWEGGDLRYVCNHCGREQYVQRVRGADHSTGEDVQSSPPDPEEPPPLDEGREARQERGEEPELAGWSALGGQGEGLPDEARSALTPGAGAEERTTDVRDGTQAGHGAASRPLPGTLGAGASSERTEGRQQAGELGASDEGSTQGRSDLPPLSNSVSDSLTCCGVAMTLSACDHVAPPTGGPQPLSRPDDGGGQGMNSRRGNDGQYRETCGKCGARRVDRQIGLEETPQDWCDRLVAVFREVRRVLRDDGVLFIEIGDSYAAAGGHAGQGDSSQRQGRTNVAEQNRGSTRVPSGYKQKDLIGQPWLLAFALRADGWYLRSEIIWSKPNPMPESVQGSAWVRHRVTMKEYERLSRLRAGGVGAPSVGTGDVPDVQAREVPRGQASVPAEREGEGDREGARGTGGRAGETTAVLSVPRRQEEPGEVRGDTEGRGDEAAGAREIQGERTREEEGERTASAYEGRSQAAGTTQVGRPAIQAESEGEGVEVPPVREAEAGDPRDDRSADSGAVVGDPAGTQARLPVLRGDGEVDDRPCDPAEQGRGAHAGERGPGLPELQLEEARSSGLVDCPGCPKCEAHGGLVLRMSAGRPTKAHSTVFLLSKSPSYFYDADAIRTPHQHDGRKADHVKGTDASHQHRDGPRWPDNGGANARSVWTIPTEPTPFAHFATWPQKLVRRMVLAGTSERGCCPECGAPWARETEREVVGGHALHRIPVENAQAHNRARDGHQPEGRLSVTTLGWSPSCAHDHPPVPCTVLDPFAGSATTMLVARAHGRHAIGIELNEEYLKIAHRRLGSHLNLFAPEAT